MKAKDFLQKPIPEPNYIKRMSKELARFTKATEDMNQAQAKDVVRVLQLVLAAVDGLGKDKPISITPAPMKVDITDSRPLPMGLKVTKRDRAHLIDEVEFIYGDKP